MQNLKCQNTFLNNKLIKHKILKWTLYGQCFIFSPWHPKCPWHTYFWILSRALLTFHGHIIENCHGQGQKFHGHFFQNFHGQVGKFTGISKNSCHGHFDVCHGHFCALISNFLIYSSHNKGDIWSLVCREFTIFSKKKARNQTPISWTKKAF